MSEVNLIAVSKDGAYLEVHPTCLEAHLGLGWKECEKREEESEGGSNLSVAQLKEALTAKGIEIPAGAKKADLQALLDA